MNSLILSGEMLVASKYQSHLPALLACIGDTVGDVLEVGVGHFSTPQLHALCGAMDRKLVSVESDSIWFYHFEKMLGNSQSHMLFMSPLEEVIALQNNRKWSVAFIDHSPGGENRALAFDLLVERSQFVVVHDYWQDNEEAIVSLLGGLNHHVTRTYEPPTLIASKSRAIPRSVLCL